MYQALYRKYRPTSFDEVVGQEVITRTLKNAIKNNKLSHAYLFTGPRGTGKTTIAKILAKTINCKQLNNNIPCDNCVSCTQINNKQSTDIVEIDAASNNGVDEIREIRNKVNLVPSVSQYKVYIIDEVHMLTVGAFNALLKTLEEPPAHIIFILATTDPHKIPSTILSRCQRFDFKKIDKTKLVERLKYISEQETIKIEKLALEEISRLSDGGMRDAISMLDQALSYSEENITLNDIHEINGTLSQEELAILIENIFKNNILDVLKLIDTYNNLGKNIIKLSEEIIMILKNVLLLKTIENYFESTSEYYQLYKNLGNKIDNEKIIILIDIFNDNLMKLKMSNDPKLILELLIIKYISSNKKEIVSSELGNKGKDNISKAEKTDKTKENIHNQSENIEIKNTNTIIEEKEKSLQVEEPKQNTESKKSIKKDDDKIWKEIKEIRVNNTLSGFNKSTFLQVKKNLENIKDMLLVPEYSQIISVILDGTLKAASDKNIIFVYNTETLANYFNENLLLIEELIEKNYNMHYDVIGIDNISWEIIKKEFNSKNKKYVYTVEQFDLHNILKNKNNVPNELNNLFGEIVEIIN